MDTITYHRSQHPQSGNGNNLSHTQFADYTTFGYRSSRDKDTFAAPLNDGLKEAVNYIISANSTLECSGKLEILCFLFYVEMSVSVDSWG